MRCGVHLLAGEGGGVDVAGAGQFHQLHVVLAEPGLFQDPQHQGALGLARAVGDLLAAQLLQGGDSCPGGDAQFVERVVHGVLPEGAGDDPHVQARPRCVDRRDVRHGADVQRVGPERFGGLRAAGDVGELHLEVQFLDQAGQLQGHLHAGIAHGDGGAGGNGGGERGSCLGWLGIAGGGAPAAGRQDAEDGQRQQGAQGTAPGKGGRPFGGGRHGRCSEGHGGLSGVKGAAWGIGGHGGAGPGVCPERSEGERWGADARQRRRIRAGGNRKNMRCGCQ